MARRRRRRRAARPLAAWAATAWDHTEAWECTAAWAAARLAQRLLAELARLALVALEVPQLRAQPVACADHTDHTEMACTDQACTVQACTEAPPEVPQALLAQAEPERPLLEERARPALPAAWEDSAATAPDHTEALAAALLLHPLPAQALELVSEEQPPQQAQASLEALALPLQAEPLDSVDSPQQVRDLLVARSAL